MLTAKGRYTKINLRVNWPFVELTVQLNSKFGIAPGIAHVSSTARNCEDLLGLLPTVAFKIFKFRKYGIWLHLIYFINVFYFYYIIIEGLLLNTKSIVGWLYA